MNLGIPQDSKDVSAKTSEVVEVETKEPERNHREELKTLRLYLMECSHWTVENVEQKRLKLIANGGTVEDLKDFVFEQLQTPPRR